MRRALKKHELRACGEGDELVLVLVLVLVVTADVVTWWAGGPSSGPLMADGPMACPLTHEPNPSSAQRSLRLAARLGPTGHPGARGTRGREDLAVPQSHEVG